jgi:thymidine phosphorylase
MKLMNRVIEILEQGKPLDEAEESVREVNQVFENLEAIGNLSKLVEKTGSSVGLSESWLRTEVLKSLKTDESIC